MLVESSMMKLGTVAPDFVLPDTVSGNEVSLGSLESDVATVVMFICNHCPFVHHVNAKLVEIAGQYQEKGLVFIAISSNDSETHPEDGPDLMAKTAKIEGYPFPYLYDETQKVAKAYRAECTPDFFVFDSDLKCAYRGRFDDSRPSGTIGATGRDLTHALDALRAGRKVPETQIPSVGCNIKWKKS